LVCLAQDLDQMPAPFQPEKSNSCQSRFESSVDGVDKEVMFTFKNGAMRKFTGRSLLLTFSVPQFFFHVTTSLRHPASRRCGSRQEGFFGATAINLKQEWRAEA